MRTRHFSRRSMLFTLLACSGSSLVQANPISLDNLAGFEKAQALTQHVRSLLEQENFTALDAFANEARTSKARFADGEWKLFALYQSVIIPAAGLRAGEADWEPHLARLQRWHKASSKSATAHIAYGGGLIEYALKAHVGGQEWNAMGTELGGKVFQARLKAGLAVFNGLKKIKDRCPHLYYVQLRLAMAQGWSWAEFNIPYAEGIALEPTYHYFYQAKAFNYLPRNRGGQGEWELYANEIFRQLGEEDGALMYYQIVSHLRPSFNQRLFAENRINWSRLKAGYQVLVARYGGDSLRHNEMAYFSVQVRDQIAAKNAFDRIGGARNSEIWGSAAKFEQARAWAFENAPKAMSKKQDIR